MGVLSQTPSREIIFPTAKHRHLALSPPSSSVRSSQRSVAPRREGLPSSLPDLLLSVIVLRYSKHSCFEREEIGRFLDDGCVLENRASKSKILFEKILIYSNPKLKRIPLKSIDRSDEKNHSLS